MKRALILFLTILHWILVLYCLIGWVWPAGEGWRLVYAIYIPLIVLQWLLNNGVCVLNNIESWLTTGQWRNPGANPEEGAFVLTNFNRLTGFDVSGRTYHIFLYTLLAMFWLINLYWLLTLS